MGARRGTPPRALLLVALLAVAVLAPAPLDPYQKTKGKGRSRKAPKGAALLSRRKARAKEGPLPRGRKVYIDLEAGFGNTLRLHHDLIGAVHARVPPAARSPRAWEVYGFEASPLAQPYADAFTTWLDATSSVTRADSASSARLARYPRLTRGRPSCTHSARRCPIESCRCGVRGTAWL